MWWGYMLMIDMVGWLFLFMASWADGCPCHCQDSRSYTSPIGHDVVLICTIYVRSVNVQWLLVVLPSALLAHCSTS